MLGRRIGICVMGFDPPLPPLKRGENLVSGEIYLNFVKIMIEGIDQKNDE
ncbi:hypothetical protein MICAB_1740006 [Microcystis aeruginosa PCC 9717]|uniref:Uncharacterized protein n=2 Tax=Microcystis aeruginosa TaxID=1126 RepID=I4FKQ3_MICAE|nr:hypothetical protein MICAB_1740006 [Microcystis aeruginosa PCC 9717]